MSEDQIKSQLDNLTRLLESQARSLEAHAKATVDQSRAIQDHMLSVNSQFSSQNVILNGVALESSLTKQKLDMTLERIFGGTNGLGMAQWVNKENEERKDDIKELGSKVEKVTTEVTKIRTTTLVQKTYWGAAVGVISSAVIAGIKFLFTVLGPHATK